MRRPATSPAGAVGAAAPGRRSSHRPRPRTSRLFCFGAVFLAFAGAVSTGVAQAEKTEDGNRWTFWRWPWRNAARIESSTFFLPNAAQEARRDQVREESRETVIRVRERERIISRRKDELRQYREARIEAAIAASSARMQTSPPAVQTVSVPPEVAETTTEPPAGDNVGAAASSARETWQEVRDVVAGVAKDIRDKLVTSVASEVAGTTSAQSRSTGRVMMLLLAALPIPCLMVACMTVGVIQWRRNRPVQGFVFLVAGGTVAGFLYLIVAGG